MLNAKLLLTGFFIISQCIVTHAQEAEIIESFSASGTVFDAATGRSIEGINISLPGYATTITDSSGHFLLRVPSLFVNLVISGLHYQQKEIALSGRSSTHIYMYEEGYPSLNEHANMYYRQQPLTQISQSVTSINKGHEGWRSPVVSPESVLKGRIAGLNVVNRSGNLGIGANMFLRGYSSLYAGNQPLIVMDGMIYENNSYNPSIVNGYLINPLANIDIDDIENVTVVKDACSIYGAQASNGVIFIRTRRAYEAATTIDFSLHGGYNFEPSGRIPLMDADNYRIYLAEILQSSGLMPDSIQSLPYMINDEEYVFYNRYHNNYNWREDVFSGSYNQGANLKISGGDDVALYALSIGYLNHAGIVSNTDFSRYSIRFNTDIDVSRRFSVNTNLFFTYNMRNLKDDGISPATNPIHVSHFKSPFTYPYVINPNGTISPGFEDSDALNVSNPAALVENFRGNSNNSRTFGSFNFNFQLNQHLRFSNLIGIGFDKRRESLFIPHLGVAPRVIDRGIAENQMGHLVEQVFSFQNDFRAAYSRSFNHHHHVSGLLGLRVGLLTLENDYGYGYNSPNDQMRSLGTGVSSLREIGGLFGDRTWLTYYGMADYNFQHRYFLSLAVALDGSSRFGEEAKGVSLFSSTFGFFPTISGAWIASAEQFFPEIDQVDLVKLRVSYGRTGNGDIGDYAAQKHYLSKSFLGAQGLVMGMLWNPELKWETTASLNAGLDLALFRERMSVSLDLFSRNTRDMLNIIPASPLSGYEYYLENNGRFTNKGFEVAVQGRLINNTLKWDMGMNLAKYRNKVVEFPGDRRITNILGANMLTEVGQPLGVYYGYKTDGVFASTAEVESAQLQQLMPNSDLVPFAPGDVRFVEADVNNIIDDNDMQIIGDPNPDLTGMFNNRLEWKGISLDATMVFSYGNDVFNYFRQQLESMQNTNNQSAAVNSRWRSEGQVTDVPRAAWGDPIGNARFSDRWIEDGSYLRLRDITLGYKFRLRSGYFNDMEVYVSGQNLLTLTRYMGMDPEFSINHSPLYQGIDIGLIPQVRSVNIGVRVGL